MRRRSGDRNGRRRVIVKTRTVRMAASSRSALMKHIGYIRRDSALSKEDRGQLFDRDSDTADSRPFVEDASRDRHHYRFIISPEEGAELADLKPFVRDLVGQMEKDLATRLEWIGAEHHDTGRPHVHLIVRGRHQDGQDLKIPRSNSVRRPRRRWTASARLNLPLNASHASIPSWKGSPIPTACLNLKTAPSIFARNMQLG